MGNKDCAASSAVKRHAFVYDREIVYARVYLADFLGSLAHSEVDVRDGRWASR